jgi:hypothetical protein
MHWLIGCVASVDLDDAKVYPSHSRTVLVSFVDRSRFASSEDYPATLFTPSMPKASQFVIFSHMDTTEHKIFKVTTGKHILVKVGLTLNIVGGLHLLSTYMSLSTTMIIIHIMYPIIKEHL